MNENRNGWWIPCNIDAAHVLERSWHSHVLTPEMPRVSALTILTMFTMKIFIIMQWSYFGSSPMMICTRFPIIFIILIIIVSILHHNHNQEDHHHHLPCLSPWWQPWPVAPEEAQVSAFWTSTWDVSKRLQQSTQRVTINQKCGPWVGMPPGSSLRGPKKLKKRKIEVALNQLCQEHENMLPV